MCGRFALCLDAQMLVELYRLAGPVIFGPRYNLAPTQESLVIVPGADRASPRRARVMRWGLVPSWAKDTSIASRMINARGEEAAQKPAFRSALARRRCVVPASGFFEWSPIDGARHKQPWYITPTSQPVLSFAGLWEHWDGPTPGTPDGGDDAPPGATARADGAGGEHADRVPAGGGSSRGQETFAVLTISANGFMRSIHDRMPVLLGPEGVDEWLDPNTTPERVASLIRPADEGVLTKWAVGTRVNSPRNDGPGLIAPVEPERGLFGV
jgi:putative SOS response-associated peptidase YedK